ncbi:MAG: triose-phosphate isomerase [Patescibacteria group bacterium]
MKKLIIANWKMNPDTPREARRLFGKVKRTASRLSRALTIVCPPAVFLPLLQPGKNLALGGQDIFSETRGALARPDGRLGGHTGSISAAQIKYAGAEYVILGHSERRGLGESDELINKKIKLALAVGLRVILCVGETTRDERGDYLRIIREMLERDLARVARAELKSLVIAYEPVWAIGGETQTSDTPEDFLEQSLFIRKILAARFGQSAALAVPVLYGGSVAPANAADFLTRGEAAGLLVGHESLRADHFNEILRLANRPV